MNLGIKIKALREERGLTQIELANLSDTSRASIQLYEADKVNIPVKNLEKIAKALNVSSDYFLSSNLSSKNENFVKQSPKTSSNMSLSPEKSEKLQKLQALIEEQENRLINLRFFPSVSTAAGYGANNDNESFKNIPITASFLTNVLRIPARQYDVINVLGDSMEPFLKDGDMVLVLPTHEASNGEIVIANINGDLYVKKLLRDPINREVRLTSMNELYKDIVITGDELEMLKIVGIVKKVLPSGAFTQH